MNWKQVAVTGILLGAVAGYVVWWLRRFEVEDLHARFSEYLTNYDNFRRWEAEHGPGGTD